MIHWKEKMRFTPNSNQEISMSYTQGSCEKFIKPLQACHSAPYVQPQSLTPKLNPLTAKASQILSDPLLSMDANSFLSLLHIAFGTAGTTTQSLPKVTFHPDPQSSKWLWDPP